MTLTLVTWLKIAAPISAKRRSDLMRLKGALAPFVVFRLLNCVLF
jgi:hypothetical protein